MNNKQAFIKAVKQASKVFVATQLIQGDVSYVQAVKADVLFTIKDYPVDTEFNYTSQDSDSVRTLVFIN